MSTVSLPPTIRGGRNHVDDAERREIFPISDKGAPTLPIGRRGSIACHSSDDHQPCKLNPTLPEPRLNIRALAAAISAPAASTFFGLRHPNHGSFEPTGHDPNNGVHYACDNRESDTNEPDMFQRVIAVTIALLAADEPRCRVDPGLSLATGTETGPVHEA
ncbi:hypothetical protein BGW42_004572 [Actinomortierella wolfii]|nr:hypothetical protein BGW42_004572 [Actinomortierella wolfii]